MHPTTRGDGEHKNYPNQKQIVVENGGHPMTYHSLFESVAKSWGCPRLIFDEAILPPLSVVGRRG